MKVIFSHGKESGPWGTKIRALADAANEMGFLSESVDYTGMTDPDERVERLLEHMKGETEGIVLIGSSMGGYVSLVASERVSVEGVFMLAPALYMDGYRQQAYSARQITEIVHGWSDDLVPYGSSVNFAKQSNSTLHLIKGDHRLNSSLDTVISLFQLFLKRVSFNGRP